MAGMVENKKEMCRKNTACKSQQQMRV